MSERHPDPAAIDAALALFGAEDQRVNWCPACGRPMPLGDRVRTADGTRLVHAACRARLEEETS
jgi:hypothetical protein